MRCGLEQVFKIRTAWAAASLTGFMCFNDFELRRRSSTVLMRFKAIIFLSSTVSSLPTTILKSLKKSSISFLAYGYSVVCGISAHFDMASQIRLLLNQAQDTHRDAKLLELTVLRFDSRNSSTASCFVRMSSLNCSVKELVKRSR